MRSQQNPMRAVQMGVVALSKEQNPEVRWRLAQQKRLKGSAELKRPRIARGSLQSRRALRFPGRRRKGRRARAAPAMRVKVVEIGPNSGTAMRMNRKEAPQIAERRISRLASERLTFVWRGAYGAPGNCVAAKKEPRGMGRGRQNNICGAVPGAPGS
jgi:hypothetical protein